MIEIVNDYKKASFGGSIKNAISFSSKLGEMAMRVSRNKLDARYDSQIRKHIEKMNSGKFRIFRHIYIETINRCNGGCRFCHANRFTDKREMELMDEGLLEKILKELKEMEFKGWISFHRNNEPFLDKRIFDFVKMMRESMPDALINIHSNGTLLNIEKIYRIMPHLSFLNINNYNDKLELHDNIRETVEHFNRTNEFDGLIKVCLRKENEILLNRASSAPNRKMGYTMKSPCLYPFEQLNVCSNGNISICCNDAFEDVVLGNAGEQTLEEIWHGEKFKDIRDKMLMDRNLIKICGKCDIITPPTRNPNEND
ncbi:MAG TPA: hypothetical protein DCZ94_09430 [Lentisphaeria bacterium]|nr:MAG: hypothetical protein A2X48_18215 [Lentisphaerae bacterium GWF2_49_21]HBC87162.1 hypothetical protein [Lentisphaeria bacterium]